MSFTEIPIYHTYEMWEPRLPQPGDKALCGYELKTDDPLLTGLLPVWGQGCVVCMDLERYREWVTADESDGEW